jgi:uroporphyrinogen decarboxylase
MNDRENFLEAIRFGRPDHVPLACEGIWQGVELAGNYRGEDWTDSWGISWRVGIPGTVPFPHDNPLPTLDRLGDYHFPSPAALVYSEDARAGLAKVDRATTLIDGRLTYLLFERAWAIMGMENFLVAMHTHPAEMHVFLHGIADYARKVFDRYLEIGVDAVASSEDLGTQRALFMSPGMVREFMLPEYAYIFENVLRAGRIVKFHSCGCIDEIAGDLAGIGITMLNPVQARANDLARVKRATYGRMALEGAIDTAVLARGGVSDVRREAARVIEILKPGGGYVCGPDQGIPGIPEENMTALWDTARELGRY